MKRMSICMVWTTVTAVAAVSLTPGCRLSGQAGRRASVEVVLVDSRTVTVADRTVPLRGASKAVRAAGAGPDTDIRVSIGPQTDPRVMSAVASELAGAGFRRVMFLRPPKASATSEESPAP